MGENIKKKMKNKKNANDKAHDKIDAKREDTKNFWGNVMGQFGEMHDKSKQKEWNGFKEGDNKNAGPPGGGILKKKKPKQMSDSGSSDSENSRKRRKDAKDKKDKDGKDKSKFGFSIGMGDKDKDNKKKPEKKEVVPVVEEPVKKQIYIPGDDFNSSDEERRNKGNYVNKKKKELDLNKQLKNSVNKKRVTDEEFETMKKNDKNVGLIAAKKEKKKKKLDSDDSGNDTSMSQVDSTAYKTTGYTENPLN